MCAMTLTAEQILADRGGRTTKQRLLVLQAVMGVKDDVTAQALHAALRHDHPKLGLATVYRTLNSLAEAGIIHALPHGDSTCYRYCAPGHHHHFTCRKCHRVVEIRECELDHWATRVANEHGFRDVTHTVELSGLCNRC